jgi:hypothetical protein
MSVAVTDPAKRIGPQRVNIHFGILGSLLAVVQIKVLECKRTMRCKTRAPNEGCRWNVHVEPNNLNTQQYSPSRTLTFESKYEGCRHSVARV